MQQKNTTDFQTIRKVIWDFGTAYVILIQNISEKDFIQSGFLQKGNKKYSMRNRFKTDGKTEGSYEPGVRKEVDGIRFSVVAGQGQKISLLLYEKEKEGLVTEIPFPEQQGSVRSVKIMDLDWTQYRYNYRIDGKVVPDEYARGLWEDSTGRIFCEMNFASFSWKKSRRPRIPYEEGIMYHLHVRNYTMNEKSGVTHRGTFLGLQEKIPYLKKLGVNQIILMPVYEFLEEEKEPEKAQTGKLLKRKPQQKNYWGYKKGFYFAPKRKFAATEDPVLELKNMIKTFHEQQMEVILEMYFPQEVVLREQTEILRYWMEEYQIDGFRIMGETDLAHHLGRDPLFCDVKLISYYYGDMQVQTGQSLGMNLAEMNDGFLNDMRRILKGDEGSLEQMAFRTRRNPQTCAVINYITGHDGFTLQDLVSYDKKHNEANGENNLDGCQCNYSWNCGVEGESRKRDIVALRTRMKKNAMLLLLFSQGTPMILAGDEFGNTQKGNNNPYCLDDPISWVDWDGYKRNLKFVNYVRALIAIRKAEKLLHRKDEYCFMDQQAYGYPDLSYHGSKAWYADFGYAQRTLGMLYCGSYVKEEHFLYVMYNLHPQEQELALPKLPEKMNWYKKIDTSLKESIPKEKEQIDQKKKTVTVPGRTIIVLTGEEE